MAIKKYKPTTPGRRGMTVYTFEEITRSKPEKCCIVPLKSTGGRNNHGRTHRSLSRRRPQAVSTGMIDFRRDKDGIPAKVAAIEYDPNRSAALLAPLRGW